MTTRCRTENIPNFVRKETTTRNVYLIKVFQHIVLIETNMFDVAIEAYSKTVIITLSMLYENSNRTVSVPYTSDQVHKFRIF